ncbi:MAG: cyclic nucleotide-binding domain-containing protein [Epsilonproteobacteria bacterium]|nr:cyclic nucleotide-binding domain-containing protein [Campylobacterota bacterium]
MINHPIFKLLRDDEVKSALEYFNEVEYKKGDVIVKEGEYNSTAFILLEGEVEILKQTIYNDDFLKTTKKAPSDELFCEINLIDRGLVGSTIVAKSDVSLLSITHDEFINLLDKYPQIGSKMLWVISYDLTKHLRKADKDIITLFNALVEVVEND